jgi:spore coat polysaccharide biosynthesis predicted glycosyltransferase SpsG/SAM-dependent methyltransferase
MSHDTINYTPSLLGIRADGSVRDGLGHLQRQLTLARTLRERFAWDPIFLSATEEILCKLFDRPDEFKIHPLCGDALSGLQEADICRSLGLKLLVCDVKQPLGEDFVKAIQLAGTGVWLYGNTGPGRRVADCNVFAFPGVAKELLADYADIRRIDSPDNAMMSPIFAQLRLNHLPKSGKEPLRIFLSMGGSDHDFLTGRVVDALISLSRSIHLDCVIGPAFAHEEELATKLAAASFSWHIHRAPEYFPYLAAACDLAITQMGNTVAELNCLGLPVLLFNSSEFHCQVADIYCRDGSAVNLGRAETPINDLGNQLQVWLDGRAGRERLRSAGLEKIDGRGVIRVAVALFRELQDDFVLVDCDVCGSDAFEALHLLHSRPMVRCCRCGLHYMNVRPSPELLEQVYAAEYFTAPRTQGDISNYEADKPNVLRFARTRLAALERLLPGKGRLLDVGCALGFYLEEAKQRGWQVCGMDISAYAIDFVRDRHGIEDVHRGTVETLDFPREHFDAIICSLVFEHFLDPRACLIKLAAWLRPGGYLVLKIPHAGGVMCRFTPESWFASHPDNHFCDYTPETLKRLLLAAGILPTEWITEGIYLERFADALHLDDQQRSQFLAIPGLTEKYQAFAANNLLGDSLVMFGRKL